MGVRRKVTIREVAARAGVSVSTVSRVLNGRDAHHMRPETKERVLRAIEELEYTPVKAARSLRCQRTQVIGILVPDISNPFFSLLARGVASVAFESGYSTLICDSDHSVEKESRYLDILLSEGVEGIVFVPVGRPDMGRIERLLRRGIRIVAADRRVEGLPTVEADNRGGSRELTRYVLSLGYRRIAYIAGPEEVSTAQDRLLGFQEAMEEAGLAPVAVRHGNFTYESGYELARGILEKGKVDAIMCGNDLMAIGAIRAAEDLGLRVPEDLGVTGFDHVLWSDLVQPKLTTVEIPAYNLGQVAIRQFMKADNRNRLLEARIIPGATCVQRGW
ncbi:TPA: LacI family transcriptional regulator [Candidatus Acetothermia bacterium]|nr:LacI family transcriptional regulator [Candidatus Acetothermia bacterium]